MRFSKKHLALIVILLMTAVTSVWADTETIKVEYYHRGINYMTGQLEGYWRTKDVIRMPDPVDGKIVLRITEDNYASYYVDRNIECTTIEVENQFISIILGNNTTLRCTGGVKIPDYASLEIYSQSYQDLNENQGRLVVTQSTEGAAAIGGTEGQRMGSLTICGGNILATGAKRGAGIGTGGCYSDTNITDCGEVIVYGGQVTAYGGECAAGIGGGGGNADNYADGVDYTQYGGHVTVTGGEFGAGLGGGGGYHWLRANYDCLGGSVGKVNIMGGTLTAHGGRRAAGIGSGNINWSHNNKNNYYSNGHQVNISGGEVTAYGGDYAAGIGGGCNGQGVHLTVSGGIVRAFGQKNGAGIGGGEDGLGGETIISGGTVYAVAGAECNATESEGGSAIGCGKGESHKDNYDNGDQKNILSFSFGSKVKVIAGSSETNLDERTVSGGRVNACHWRNYVEIEPCNHDDEDAVSYSINDGITHNLHCRFCAYEQQENHVFNDGKCVCGLDGVEDFCVIRLYDSQDETNAEKPYDTIPYQALKVKKGDDCILPDPFVPAGMIFKGWATTKKDNVLVTNAELESLKQIGDTVSTEGQSEIEFYARYAYVVDASWEWASDFSSATVTLTATNYPSVNTFVQTYNIMGNQISDDPLTYSYTASTEVWMHQYGYGTFTDTKNVMVSDEGLMLPDANDNSETILEYDGWLMSKVVLSGRTLYRDGTWNTLCLPFAVDNIFDSPLRYADVRTLESSSFDNGTLTLNFSESGLTSMKAGKPYLIRWTGDKMGQNLVNPKFENVLISGGFNDIRTDYAYFWGTYGPLTLEIGNTSALYVNGDKVCFSSNGVDLNSCRGYFVLNGLTTDDITSENNIILNFGGGETTTIDHVQSAVDDNADDWYTIDGRRMNRKPTAKGVYIHQGKKKVIK